MYTLGVARDYILEMWLFLKQEVLRNDIFYLHICSYNYAFNNVDCLFRHC